MKISPAKGLDGDLIGALIEALGVDEFLSLAERALRQANEGWRQWRGDGGEVLEADARRSLAHRLKGSVAAVGLKSLAAEFARLEAGIAQGGKEDPWVRQAMEASLDEAELFLKNLASHPA
ncbi:HPt (histidine-containing phosphotransfer) domain-containing protein [Haloferula luteola]|uniref:HPt (Histidine-containing phosphotransfer) domain-containing protein n=1 Tax=Haloferula luteola TaxID=595692 RepID=A0A840VFV3_9BACT|nr:Hpt domain-containing protein [Haloferula luteola]MBB5352699.1 HPt (histidine-containing phosphotransfer) domain-containing protein [Haloferula luteola]